MPSPPAGSIQTVLGPIAKNALGRTDAHEHLIRDGGVLVDADAGFLLNDVAAAAAELELFRAAGGGALVDMTPTAPGRNPLLVRELSRRTGVHVIASTGFVDWALPSNSPAWRCSEAELADRLVAEICEGMDAANYSGDQVERTDIRAGVIKISLEHEEPTAAELRFIGAAAHAHCLTGAAIVVHTDRGKGSLGLLCLLSQRGVDPSAVVISHAFHSGDHALLESLVRQGAYVVADGVGKPKYDEASIVQCLCKLVDHGYDARLLLGLDLSRRKYWKSYGGSPGMDYLVLDLVERLRERRVPDAAIEQMLVTNPATVFAMRARVVA
jgi:phosphotriesterase-related protein